MKELESAGTFFPRRPLEVRGLLCRKDDPRMPRANLARWGSESGHGRAPEVFFGYRLCIQGLMPSFENPSGHGIPQTPDVLGRQCKLQFAMLRAAAAGATTTSPLLPLRRRRRRRIRGQRLLLPSSAAATFSLYRSTSTTRGTIRTQSDNHDDCEYSNSFCESQLIQFGDESCSSRCCEYFSNPRLSARRAGASAQRRRSRAMPSSFNLP